MGRSSARNHGVSESDGDWIFFLDADDLMHPMAFEAAAPYMQAHAAVFGNIWEFKDGLAHWRYQVPEIDNYADLLKFDPYLTLQMGHFVRKDVADVLRFDTQMDTGEDWDYYLRLWQQFPCIKIPEPLMINRRGQHSTGPRSATGRQWTEVVHKMLADAREAEK